MSSLVKLNKISSHLSEVVINRPEKLNAMTKPMWIELGKIFKKISKEKNLRCVIIRGEGGKSFSPGNDIGEFKKERSSSKLAKSYGKFLHGTLGSIFNCPVPTIAMIEGICVGGGLEIAACCDIRICGKSSRFGIPNLELFPQILISQQAAISKPPPTQIPSIIAIVGTGQLKIDPKVPCKNFP